MSEPTTPPLSDADLYHALRRRPEDWWLPPGAEQSGFIGTVLGVQVVGDDPDCYFAVVKLSKRLQS